jgi:hypothetical protein
MSHQRTMRRGLAKAKGLKWPVFERVMKGLYREIKIGKLEVCVKGEK